MNEQRNQDIDNCLAELQAVVDSYHPEYEYFNTFVLLSLCAIVAIVIFTIGLFLGFLLLSLGIIPILYKVLTSNDRQQTTKELSEKACILMSSCINYYKYPESTLHILQYTSYLGSNNLVLYKEFISIFPNMASKKLKKLSSVLRG